MIKKRVWMFGCVLLAGSVLACMNIEFAPTFTVDRYPASKDFIEGNLGVIKPRFYHNFLFISYRHLSGLGLGEEEKRSLAGKSGQLLPDEPRGYEKWRQTIGSGAPSDWSAWYKRPRENDYSYFLNCSEEAYEAAVRTFQERSKQFGEDSREVALWLEAQKQVFSNCGGGRTIPEPLGADVNPAIRADREYQGACAHFYAGDFDEAARRFELIAADGNSAWQDWGRYLAARCYLRKGMLVEGYRKFDRESLEQAAVRFRQVLADLKLSRLHASSRGLLNFIQVRLEPQQRLEEASRVLLASEPGEDLGEAWTDFDYLLDRGVEPKSKNDLWLWLQTIRGEATAVETAIEKWKATRELHWLVASLLSVTADNPHAAELLEAARQVPEPSPGYVTVTYHRLRLALEKRRDEEVRRELDRFLAKPELKMPPASRNLFLSIRFRSVATFDELLKYAPREPIHLDFWGARREGSDKYLDKDSLVVFNTRLPLTLLEEAIKRPTLPTPIRRELTLSAWCRAVLIVERQAAARLQERVKEHWPELREELTSYEAEKGEAGRQFAFAFLLLRHPGVVPYLRGALHRATPISRIDDFRENWWCEFHHDVPMHLFGYAKRYRVETLRSHPEWAKDWPREDPGQGPVLAFLSPREVEAARSELARLTAIPPAPDFLCAETLKWARAHPGDPRVPQALHLAVRATRYGCEGEQTTEHSRRAYQFLHRNYPSSEWAKATPYWY